MPFIHIKSLPLDGGLSVSDIVEGISRDFSEQVGIEIEQVTATWEGLSSWHYAAAGRAAANQPNNSHPILVDLLVPDFYPPDLVEKMLTSVAASISKRAGVSDHNIFINLRLARSGQVFDAGEIVRW